MARASGSPPPGPGCGGVKPEQEGVSAILAEGIRGQSHQDEKLLQHVSSLALPERDCRVGPEHSEPRRQAVLGGRGGALRGHRDPKARGIWEPARL